jgi:hypothetical protein
MPTLIDKRFVSSRVKLQGVRIELTSLQVQKPTPTITKPWQQALAEVVSALHWENLRDDCEALLKSENILNELDERMRGWLLRSQQILVHADQLTQAIQAYSNPLRHQNEIRSQLAQIEQLRREQDNLHKQFTGVNALLASQLKEVQALGERDIAAIRTRCGTRATSLQNLAAEQIVSEWAKQLVFRQLRLSLSIATLLQVNNRSNPFNVNVRSDDPRLPLISLSGIEADGLLSDSLKSLPFTAKGEYSAVHKAGYQLARKSDWTIQFDADHIATLLNLASVEEDSSWHVNSRSSESNSNLESTSGTLLGDVQNANTFDGATMLELDASISGRRLRGKARMNLGMYRAFAKIPCTGNADLSATELTNDSTPAEINEPWIEFNLSGSAHEPLITLDSRLPSEFIDTVTDRIRKRLETQCVDSESKHKLALDTKIAELSQRLELVARNGQQTVAKQREALTAMHRELEQNLQSREGIEYARLPGKPNSNH